MNAALALISDGTLVGLGAGLGFVVGGAVGMWALDRLYRKFGVPE